MPPRDAHRRLVPIQPHRRWRGESALGSSPSAGLPQPHAVRNSPARGLIRFHSSSSPCAGTRRVPMQPHRRWRGESAVKTHPNRWFDTGFEGLGVTDAPQTRRDADASATINSSPRTASATRYTVVSSVPNILFIIPPQSSTARGIFQRDTSNRRCETSIRHASDVASHPRHDPRE